MRKIIFYSARQILTIFLFVTISQSTVFSAGFELDLALGSTYDASTTRSLLGVSSSGEAKLEGSNLRFIYMKDDNVGYGLRLANHEGEDTKDLSAGNAYKISVSETSPFFKYGKNFNEGSDTVIEAYGLAGLNIASITASHTILDEITASTASLMLEGGIFAGLNLDDISFGGGLSLPIDSYIGKFSWSLYGYTLDYDVDIKKRMTLYLFLRSEL